MKFKNRNLLLFFEENEDKNNISSNLVRMFMNRYVIEEEKRYEIIGTFNLSKVYSWSHSDSSKMFKINWKFLSIIETDK